ncbi:MAG TPA: ATP-dependent Clp protease proteolytic subunit, partial [Coxiellaceae bacterium]|nr:ATP-dependent Clp protease proteolytic subunit [Coxiellaceae bacterium]
MSDNNSLEQELVTSLIKDRKSDRRWRNLRFFIFIFLLLAFFGYMHYTPSPKPINEKKGYVSLVRMYGPIFSDKAFSAEEVIPELHSAFKDKDSKGVVLLIDSPGGSPVQASIIHDKILQLKKKYHKKVIVLGGDTLASAAYLISTA